MDIQQIPRADLLDILFEGRNKEYGAYDLRKSYNRRLAKALSFTGAVCLLLTGTYVLAGKLHGHAAIKPMIDTEVTLIEAPQKEKPIEIPPPRKIPEPQVAMIKNPVTRIVPDNQVKPEDVPPPNDDLENAKIGLANKKGDIDDGVVSPPQGTGNAGIVEAPKKMEDEPEIFIHVEKESFYPGGTAAWQRFLQKNLHMESAMESGITSFTIVVKFIVDKEGNVSDVHAISGPEEMRKEAERVIKKSGKWEPALQNGRNVASYKQQPITVKLEGE